MKKATTGLMAVCALAGISSALAFSPRHSYTAVVYHISKSGSVLQYNTSAPVGLHCNSTDPNPACTISTSITIGTLTTTYSTSLPPQGGTPGDQDYLNYSNPGIYKMDTILRRWQLV
jgi:hypothetical protein